MEPISLEDMQHSRDPQWLRDQADQIEKQGHDLAVILRLRALTVQNRLEIVQKQGELNIIEEYLAGDL